MRRCLPLILLAACADLPLEVGAPPVEVATPPPECGGPACAPKTGAYFEGAPGAGLQLIAYPAQQQRQDARWGEALADIVNHLPASYGNTYYDADKVTYGHETSHGIHSHLRNNFNNLGRRANGFYVLRDRAALVPEPPIRKSAVGAHVPQSLRGSRFAMYITGQQAWDDTPLYVWDEWNAYVNGSEVAVDLHRRGLWDQGSRDAVEGTLEFVVYAVAVAMAVEAADAGWLRENPQMLEFLAWNTERAMRLFREGAALAPFQRASQDAYLERMRSSADAEAWRGFARRVFGAAWADAVLFGDGAVPDDVEPELPDDVEPPGEGPLGGGGGGGPGGGAGPDRDGDGIGDDLDLCDGTPPGPVWRTGDWIGCGEGQHRDRDRPDLGGGPDADGDGVPDGLDLCGGTAAGARVWLAGDWIGCAGGQRRDPPRRPGPDRDLDGIIDAEDNCSATPPGAAVWTRGEWAGCAEGQTRD